MHFTHILSKLYMTKLKAEWSSDKHILIHVTKLSAYVMGQWRFYYAILIHFFSHNHNNSPGAENEVFWEN